MSRLVLVTVPAKALVAPSPANWRQTALTLAFTITVTPQALKKR